MSRTSWIAVGLALATCHCESGPSPAPKPSTPRAEAPDPGQALRGHMRVHFAAVAELQAAIAQGRLADARETAGWFASHQMDAPPSWSPYIDEMRYAAMRIERAKDVATAGSQIGRLGRACNSCHLAQNAHPAFAYEPPPTDENTLEAQMARHQWAAARLWEGVVGPADQLWDEGARVMAMSRFDVAKSVHEKPNPDVIELAERLRAQSTQAITIKDHGARATFFGDMMETCASCHSIVRPAPVISARQEE